MKVSHSSFQAAIIPAHQAQYNPISDPGALIPPQVRQQLQDKVRPEAGVNPNTLNEINQQLATIIWAEQTQQEATRHMDNLQDGPWTTEAQHNYPYNMQNQR
ncbi:hypothetical protein PGTUg99_010012 [Puccinia graminis f. sp. tritici]|uniref:Uncharacterized protein n=1 Tax=Puccinia graminis f. sp. tritici TaxID=56615 RepID=A0A5B0QRS6_PUCGR|nr:hypothetical protein PGTUg99_010012 [Puccinia graminis f. sp. tritici]